MTFDEYQAWVRTKMKDHETRRDALLDYTISLGGEVGELQNVVKKQVFHSDTSIGLSRAIDEAGDCAWYLTALCETMGVSLEAVLRLNQKKLNARYPDGYSHERSRNRIDKPVAIENTCPFCFASVNGSSTETTYCGTCGATKHGNTGWSKQ